MQNIMLRTLTWALVFGMIITEVIPQLPSTDTPTVNRSNSDFSVTPQIPEDSVTRILSLASSTPNYPEDEEGDEEDEEEDDDGSTLSPEITPTLGSSSSSTLPPEITTSNPNAAHCPVIGIKQVAGTLVKCQCKGDEVLNADGQCQHYPKGTLIPAQKDFVETEEVPVTNYKVIVRDVKCDPEKGRLLQFTRNQFHLRSHGDLVLLKSAGDLDGQRINNYCVTHHLDEHSDLTVMAKVCVPVPAVPRCCPPGQAMKDGSCQPANTPDFLMPPIGAKPFHHSVEWPNITNYLSPLTCTDDPVKTIPHAYEESNLVSLALGVSNAWIPADLIKKEQKYYSCPNYCVDGIENPDGSVNYFTSFCYSNPKERHERDCAGRPCLRKCCKLGEVMDVNRFGCVPETNPTFKPPTVKNVSNYNIAIGWPLCTPSTKLDGMINIDESGLLIYNDKKFISTDYCVDTFVDNDASEQSAIACQGVYIESLWQIVRSILLPVCNVISVFFLSLTITCYLVVPKLLKNGGVHQLCHSISLTIAYLTSICVHVAPDYFNGMRCFLIGITMQFGFLSTFFWLNVMCFEIWRKIRNTKSSLPYDSSPTWYYMLYAWGIPIVICMITVGMQLWAPENVPGLIKPYIGCPTCWFKEDIAKLTYFYGPITILFVCNTIFLGLTYYNNKRMQQNSKEDKEYLKKHGTSNQDKDYAQEFNERWRLFLVMAFCWVTEVLSWVTEVLSWKIPEVLSWKIPPSEFWALTDTLNSLQGFFIFIIILFNRNKRKQLKEMAFKLLDRYKCTQLQEMASKCMKSEESEQNQGIVTGNDDGIFHASVYVNNSTMRKELSRPTLMSTSSSNSYTNSSFIGDDDSENKMVTQTHSPLPSSISCSSATIATNDENLTYNLCMASLAGSWSSSDNYTEEGQ